MAKQDLSCFDPQENLLTQDRVPIWLWKSPAASGLGKQTNSRQHKGLLTIQFINPARGGLKTCSSSIIIIITIISAIIIISIIRPPLSAQPSHYPDSWRCCCTPAFPNQRSRSGTSTTCKDGGHTTAMKVFLLFLLWLIFATMMWAKRYTFLHKYGSSCKDKALRMATITTMVAI